MSCTLRAVGKVVPEGRWTLAGGGASAGSENHRKHASNRSRPGGARDSDSGRSAAPFGAEFFIGAGSGGFAALYHRLISMTPPASGHHLVSGAKCMTGSNRIHSAAESKVMH